MKIIVNKNDFMYALKRASKAVGSRTVLPVLECINISAKNGEISLIGSNLDFEVVEKVDGSVTEEGNISLSASLFTNLISKFPSENIIIEAKDTTATIISGKKNFELPVLAEDFPYNKKDTAGNIEINGLELKRIITETVYPCSDNDTNPTMRSLLFDTSGKMVGLDSCRVAIKKFEGLGKDSLLVPSANMRKIAALLTDETVNVSYSDRFIRFSTPSSIITSILLDGKFFDINQLVNMNSFTTTLKDVDKSELVNVLETLSIFIKEGTKSPVVFDIKDESIIITANTELGSGKEEISSNKEGNDLKIAFNPKFLLQALNAISDETVNIGFTDEKTPVHIYGDDYLHIVLPVKVAN